MKQAETTVVKISSDLFDDKALITEGTYETIVEFTYPEECGVPMTVIMQREGQESIIKELIPGDTYTMSHRFKAEFTKHLKNSQLFPIILRFAGQKYKLNRTKQNKLILTK